MTEATTKHNPTVTVTWTTDTKMTHKTCLHN